MRTREGLEWNREDTRSDGMTVCTQVETHKSGTLQLVFYFGSTLKVSFTFKFDALINREDQSVYERLSIPNIQCGIMRDIESNVQGLCLKVHKNVLESSAPTWAKAVYYPLYLMSCRKMNCIA